MSETGQRKCLVTGARGYLGGCVKKRFAQAGWQVVDLVRSPAEKELAQDSARRFALGEEPDAKLLSGAETLVHCAYDFSKRNWREIEAVNVTGTEKLFQKAREAGVEKLVFISSMSAFEGCQSNYGRSKLEVEKLLAHQDVLMLRPGLIWGDVPGGIFGNLVKQMGSSLPQPLPGGGWPVLYLAHEADLCEVILAHAKVGLPMGAGPITAANEEGWRFRDLLGELAKRQGKTARFIPVPWRPLWLGMRLLELLPVAARFRSDSLLSLMNQNLNPSFEQARKLGLKFRPFQSGMLKI